MYIIGFKCLGKYFLSLRLVSSGSDTADGIGLRILTEWPVVNINIVREVVHDDVLGWVVQALEEIIVGHSRVKKSGCPQNW